MNNDKNENYLPVEEFKKTIPDNILLLKRTTAQPGEGFAYQLWHLLSWVGDDQEKAHNIGCGWVDDETFFLDKKRFSEVLSIPINTLNFKLRTCKFIQSNQRKNRCTYWKCEGFFKESTMHELEQIDSRRSGNEKYPDITLQALYLPLLQQFYIYTNKNQELQSFKVSSILLWEEIVNKKTLWASSTKHFVKEAANKFVDGFKNYNKGETYSFSAQKTDFAQYINSYKLDLYETSKQMLYYVLQSTPKIITILDFCKFISRFGPEDCVLEKIHQLLSCSHDNFNWFLPFEQKFDINNKISGSYSNTFANCFIIKMFQKYTKHIYNLPYSNTRSNFLIDETGKEFATWHAVLESINSSIQQYQYSGMYENDPLKLY